MLSQTSGGQTPFPYPGSAALLADGKLWRVERHNADGTIVVSLPGNPGASGRRTCDPAELADPGSRIAGREDAALALRLASALRQHDSITTAQAVSLAQEIVEAHSLPAWAATPNNVRAILAALGWEYRRARPGSFYWRRAVTTLRRVDLNSRPPEYSAGEAA